MKSDSLLPLRYSELLRPPPRHAIAAACIRFHESDTGAVCWSDQLFFCFTKLVSVDLSDKVVTDIHR